MAHHAYFYPGEWEEGINTALEYVKRELDIDIAGNPDVVIERHELFSVEDARRLITRASLAPIKGDKKVFIIAANRLFHEAQNAILKLFEEPAPGTTLILIVPSEGNIISTLRSRLQRLPQKQGKTVKTSLTEEAEDFIKGGTAREKAVERILAEAKSDDEEEKLAARAKALQLAEGLSRAGYEAWRKNEKGEYQAFLNDLNKLIPILHDRAAPLKPILEHLLITAPKKFS